MLKKVLGLLGASFTIAFVILLFIWFPYNPICQLLMLTLIVSGFLAAYFLTSFLRRTASFCIAIGALGEAIPDLLLKEFNSEYFSIKQLVIEYSDTVSICCFIIAGLCLILDTFVAGENPKEIKKNRRKNLRQQLLVKLSENRHIFDTYGPYSEHATNPLTDAHKMWNKSASKTIIPNNAKIVTLLEKNSDLLSPKELDIFHKFKLHKEGFEHNKTSKSKNKSVTTFPSEISEILK